MSFVFWLVDHLSAQQVESEVKKHFDGVTDIRHESSGLYSFRAWTARRCFKLQVQFYVADGEIQHYIVGQASTFLRAVA